WPAGDVTMSETIPGRGIKTRIGDDFFAVGNPALMQDEGIGIDSLKASAARLAKAGCSLIYVARNGQSLGVIGLKYDIKPNAALLLEQLRRNGIKELHLLSGDSHSVVVQTARDLNLTQARGDMLPEDKAAYVAGLAAGGQKVAMVGDGINDAPA